MTLEIAVKAGQRARELQYQAKDQRDRTDNDACQGDVVLVARLLGLPVGDDADDQADEAAEEGENEPDDAERPARICGSRSWRVGLVLAHGRNSSMSMSMLEQSAAYFPCGPLSCGLSVCVSTPACSLHGQCRSHL